MSAVPLRAAFEIHKTSKAAAAEMPPSPSTALDPPDQKTNTPAGVKTTIHNKAWDK